MAAYILRIAEGQTPILAALHSLLTLSLIFSHLNRQNDNGLISTIQNSLMSVPEHQCSFVVCPRVFYDL